MSTDHAYSRAQGPRADTGNSTRSVAAARMRLTAACTAILARTSSGRIVLHLLAMSGDRCVRFHAAGIVRELPCVPAALRLIALGSNSLVSAFVRHLVQPLKHAAVVDPRPLALLLDKGDVLLSDGNTRIAALVRRITSSSWSHVSPYVGPPDDGPDPRCIVEADIAAGVRSIRLSELNALQVRVLKPIGLDETDRSRLAAWVIGQLGSRYDFAHAWKLGRKLLSPNQAHSQSVQDETVSGASRFICCSLLANAFAVVGHPVSPHVTRGRLDATVEQRNLTPGDFERAPTFEVIDPTVRGTRDSGVS